MASLYPFIKEDILKDIQSGVYQEDKMLPPEREFTEKYRVSRMTIRRALDELIQDGVLIRKSGSGVFIAKNKKSRSISKVSIQTDEEIVKTYGKVIIKVVSIKTVVNHPLALRYLDVKTDEEVYQLKRVQYGGKTPIVYENIFLPKRYFNSLDKIDCTRSMSQIVHETIKVKEATNRSIEVEARLASKKLATYLEVAKNAPILKTTIIEKNAENNPLYCGVNSFDATEFKYTSE